MIEDRELEKRYIEVSKLPNLEVTCSNGKSYILLPFEHLYDIPAADVAEVRHGEWLDARYTYLGAKRYECSRCREDEFWKNDTSQSKRITAQIAVQKWTEKVIECQRQIHQENITENAVFVENVTNRVR